MHKTGKSKYVAITLCSFFSNVNLVHDLFGFWVFARHQAFKFLLRNNLKYSSRGELEISDLINIYIDDNSCDLVASLSHSDYWIDTGTCDAIVKATNFIREMKINSGNDFAKFPLFINNEPSQ